MRLLEKKPHELNWKGRKLPLKMSLTEQKSCNLLPQIEKKIKTKM